RGKRYWDLLATLSYLAAVTERIRLATNMVVLAYHHPLEIVKHYGTLDRLSRGRVVLGVGVGSLREEFDLLGARFDGRGERADDAIRAVRAAWGVREPVYRGPHFEFADVVVDPTAVQEQPPIWVGGRTPRSLRRAVELGDAWVPFLLGPDDVRTMLDRAMSTPAWDWRDRPLDVALWPEPALDPQRDPDRIVEQANTHVEAGATLLNYRFPSRSVAHHVEQMEALVELFDPAWT
ncbi:MAG: TIGR03619 family F420-dependent LLM class oxidoreductase, partial [Acidimicrobiia bacterium]